MLLQRYLVVYVRLLAWWSILLMWWTWPWFEDDSQIAISQTHCQWLISRWSREQNNHPGTWLTNELGSFYLRNFCCILKKWKKCCILFPLLDIISRASHVQEGMHLQTIHLLLITSDSSSLSSDFTPSTALLLLNQILHMLYRIWLHICSYSSFTCSMLECFYFLIGVEYIFLIILDTNNFISDVCGF